MASTQSVTRIVLAVFMGLALGVVLHQATRVLPGSKTVRGDVMTASASARLSVAGSLNNIDCSPGGILSNYSDCCVEPNDNTVSLCCQVAFENDITIPPYCSSSSASFVSTSFSSFSSLSSSSSSQQLYCCTPGNLCIPKPTASTSSACVSPNVCQADGDCCGGQVCFDHSCTSPPT